MPTYEYVCTSCHRRTERAQSFSDPPLTECPHCGGPLKRVFHPVGIVLKGSGFYTTDNRSSRKGAPRTKEPTTEPGESAPASEPSKAEPAKKPSDPAAKSAPKASEKKK